jgi:hypothetical protein
MNAEVVHLSAQVAQQMPQERHGFDLADALVVPLVVQADSSPCRTDRIPEITEMRS